ncbi:hypothetical protein GGR56DRAFT_693082 [Xylariaceae sp. FL0804]|nr:hypothetical protein GGR56DRAFT_693082 [Xylariaceae sp. FL0804]
MPYEEERPRDKLVTEYRFKNRTNKSHPEQAEKAESRPPPVLTRARLNELAAPRRRQDPNREEPTPPRKGGPENPPQKRHQSRGGRLQPGQPAALKGNPHRTLDADEWRNIRRRLERTTALVCAAAEELHQQQQEQQQEQQQQEQKQEQKQDQQQPKKKKVPWRQRLVLGPAQPGAQWVFDEGLGVALVAECRARPLAGEVRLASEPALRARLREMARPDADGPRQEEFRHTLPGGTSMGGVWFRFKMLDANLAITPLGDGDEERSDETRAEESLAERCRKMVIAQDAWDETLDEDEIPDEDRSSAGITRLDIHNAETVTHR